MSLKKILAVLLVAVLALSMAACGAKQEATDTTAAVTEESVTNEAEVTEAVSVEEETAAPEEETTEAATEAPTEKAEEPAPEEETEAPAEEETEPEKKTPTTKEEIVEFYKNAAAETDKGKVYTTSQMRLNDIRADGALGAFIKVLKPAVESALEKNSTPSDHITGGYKNLTADDVSSATAVDDGKYTTVTINLKEQTDGFHGKSREGHVGHGVTVLGDVQNAINEVNGLSAEQGNGTVQLRYNGAYIKVKIDNATGKIVSGTWYYKVNVYVDDVTMKFSVFNVNPRNMTAEITNTVTM